MTPSGREGGIFFEDLLGRCHWLPETHVLERFKVLGVARRTVRHVLPLRVVLDGVIELRGAPGKRQNTGIVRAAAPIRIWIRIQYAVLNLSLNAFPLLFWRLVFHPPNIISVFWAEAPENSMRRRFS